MYGKVFDGIFDSTLMADGGWLPTYIMENLVVMADKDGVVEVATLALYRKLGFTHGIGPEVSVADFETALKFLESPDPDSRSDACEGRRIIPLKDIPEVNSNRGWWLVNYELYRLKASNKEPRGASTERVRAFRARQNGATENQGLSPKCNGDETGRNGHTDTDTDTDTDTKEKINKKKKTPRDFAALVRNVVDEQLFLDFIEVRKRNRAANTERALTILTNKILEAHESGEDVPALMERAIECGWKTIYPKGQDKKKSLGVGGVI